ncbi:MAG: DUF1015 domain-containing protein [Candidatus Omnitrophota bacterium]
MAKVVPFSALFYQPELDYQKVLAPPYDVISPEERRTFWKLSPYNIVRVILPKTHFQAKETFKTWLNKSVLSQDSPANFYWCRQEYTFAGSIRTNQGLIALLRLEDPKKGIVCPHEETIPRVRQGQFQLLEEVSANFCPIITLYRDESRVIESLVPVKKRPFLTYQDRRGVKYSLWKIPPVPAIERTFADKKVYIADGHHRYASAYQYFLKMKTTSSAYILTYFLNSAGDDIAVLSFHRYLPKTNRKDFLAIKNSFPLSVAEPDLKTLMHNLSAGWLGLGFEGEFFRFPVPEKEDLSVSFLHQRVINEVLKFPEDHLIFEPDARALLERTRKKPGLVFFLPLLSLKSLYDIWEKKIILPRKSTYFYPKIPSGLVIYKHNGIK